MLKAVRDSGLRSSDMLNGIRLDPFVVEQELHDFLMAVLGGQLKRTVVVHRRVGSFIIEQELHNVLMVIYAGQYKGRVVVYRRVDPVVFQEMADRFDGAYVASGLKRVKTISYGYKARQAHQFEQRFRMFCV